MCTWGQGKAGAQEAQVYFSESMFEAHTDQKPHCFEEILMLALVEEGISVDDRKVKS